jgi:hypothetical protein
VGGPLHPAGSTHGAALFARYTVDSYIEESLRRWHAFVSAAAQAETVLVAESYPYQNAARILLQMDANADRIREYVAALEDIMEPLRPVLIYFEHEDATRALRAIATHRGPAWEAYATEVITDCPYARRRELHGTAGALTLMQAYKVMMDDLRQRSHLPTLVLAECAGRWEACHRQIFAFLEV